MAPLERCAELLDVDLATVRTRSGHRPGVCGAEPRRSAHRARTDQELAARIRRAEDYAALGARVVVELHTESHAAKPSTRAWAITRRAQRAHRRQADRQQRSDRHRGGRAERTDRPHQQERGMVADAH